MDARNNVPTVALFCACACVHISCVRVCTPFVRARVCTFRAVNQSIIYRTENVYDLKSTKPLPTFHCFRIFIWNIVFLYKVIEIYNKYVINDYIDSLRLIIIYYI